MPYDDDGNEISADREKVATQIAKVAQQQHLTGKRRDSFVDSASLCNSCKWASIRRQASRNNRIMQCGVFSGPCPDDITECSEYATITSLSLGQMADIAILIDTAPPKQVGFHGG